MPIKGLTTRDVLTPRFPRIGKLRKGGERETKKKDNGETYETYGRELDYFRFTSDDAAVMRVFNQTHGGQPRQVNVYLPYKTLEDNFQTWREQWKSSGLVHRCDGERTVSFLEDPAKGVYQTDPTKQKPCPGGCDPVGRLEVLIPELLQAGYVGTVTMETGSIHDLINISQTLLKTEELRNGHPLGLRGILFVLRRVPERISVPGFGKNANGRQRVEKWLVQIEPAPEWVALQMHVGEDVLDAPEPLPQLTDANHQDVSTSDIYDPVSGELIEIPARARLSGEQVQAAVMGARAYAESMAKTQEQRRAEADARRRQREIDDHAFDEEPQIVVVTQDEYDPAQDFDSLPAAVEEQILAAAAIVERIMSDQPDGWDREASPKQIGALRGLLHKVAPADEDRQALVTFMSNGHLGSAAEASMGFAGALIGAWTTVEADEFGKSKRIVTDQAKAEAAQIIAAARLAQGQTSLFVDAQAQ